MTHNQPEPVPTQLSEKGGDETCQSTVQPHQVRATGSQAPEVTKGAETQQPPPAESEECASDLDRLIKEAR